MSNIFNHNRNIIKAEIDNSEYWDFHISLNDDNFGLLNRKEDGTLTRECLISYIDITDKECVNKNKLFSKKEFKWESSINKGFEFRNIGYTGVDNGLIKYEKDEITNAEFLKIYYESLYKMNDNDFRLILNKVDGNNQLYDYSCEINEEYAKLNGGFFQGFWKTKKDIYQVLPDNIGHGITLEFTLLKHDYINENYTINDAHEENKGIFFYAGTRAENKWWKYYNVKEEYERCMKSFFGDDYIDSDYYRNTINDNYTDTSEEGFCDGYVNNEYIEDDVDIIGDEKLYTDNGIIMNSPYMGYEIKTDNKFLLFNRTKDGFTTENWEDDYEVILEGVKIPKMENYFLLFDRTKNGYTTENIQELIDEKSMEYNVNDDIYANAFGLQITDKGEIGYKFLLKDCDNIGEYKIESEFSFENIIENDKWYTISVVFEPVVDVDECNDKTYINKVANRMIMKFYVNGKLKLISKELPLFDFRELNDAFEKQEGVPYNISIGGGTQGLCDVVYINYMEEPSYILPLEKEFCGSFVGLFKSFKFYDCPLKFVQIESNSVFENNKQNNINIY